MSAHRWWLGGACAVIIAAAVGHAQVVHDASELLARAEQRVQRIDSIGRLFNGAFRQIVSAESCFGEDTVRVVDSFDVRVRDGVQAERSSLSPAPSQGIRMPPNSGKVFALRNALLPFRAVSDPGSVEVNVSRLADSVIGDRRCGVIAFDYHVRTDSARARGAGRLWIALDDFTPLRASYDLHGAHPRRGDFLSSVSVVTTPLGKGAVIAQNVTRVRFSMNTQDLGFERTEVRNSSFTSQ